MFAKIRKEAGYTQQTLAAELNVDHSTVAKWESGAADYSAKADRKAYVESLPLTADQKLISYALMYPQYTEVKNGKKTLHAAIERLPLSAKEKTEIFEAIYGG